MRYRFSRAVRLARKGLGLALLLAAVAGTASAAPPDDGYVPEIALGSMAGALTLLVGGVLMLTDRRRKG